MANVIEFVPFGDRTDHEFVHDAMSAVIATIDSDVPVPAATEQRPGPKPALVGAALVDRAPDPFRKRIAVRWRERIATFLPPLPVQ